MELGHIFILALRSDLMGEVEQSQGAVRLHISPASSASETFSLG